MKGVLRLGCLLLAASCGYDHPTSSIKLYVNDLVGEYEFTGCNDGLVDIPNTSGTKRFLEITTHKNETSLRMSAEGENGPVVFFFRYILRSEAEERVESHRSCSIWNFETYGDVKSLRQTVTHTLRDHSFLGKCTGRTLTESTSEKSITLLSGGTVILEYFESNKNRQRTCRYRKL